MPYKDDVEYIMIHCSATDPNWMENHTVEAKRDEIARWHKQRGWRAIAYAAVGDRDGQGAAGRDLDRDGDVYEEIGAGAKGWNRNCIHLCLLGGRTSDSNDKFSDHFTPEQDAWLRREIQNIYDYLGREVPLKGHNEVSAKACPGFQVRPWFENKPARKLAGSTTVQATLAGAGSTVAAAGTAISQLEGTNQTLVIVFTGIALLGFAWIMRERIKKWASGQR